MTGTRRRVAPVLLALLLVLAGCVGLGGTPTATPTDSSTATSTPTDPPTPSVTITPTSADTPDPTVDAEAALDRHRAVLDSQPGVVATVWKVERDGDGLRSRFNGTIAYDPATDERFGSFDVTADNDTRHIEQYSPPEAFALQVCVFVDGACAARNNRSTDPGSPFINPVTEAAVLQGRPDFESRGLVRTDDGQRRTFVAEGPDAVADDDSSVEFDAFRMVLFFDPDTGLLTRLVLETTYEHDGNSIEETLVVTFAYRDVDIQEPEWYREPPE